MDLIGIYKKMKEWLREQLWYQMNHHITVFILSAIVAYIFVFIGRQADTHFVTFIGGMVFMAGIWKMIKHFSGKYDE